MAVRAVKVSVEAGAVSCDIFLAEAHDIKRIAVARSPLIAERIAGYYSLLVDRRSVIGKRNCGAYTHVPRRIATDICM